MERVVREARDSYVETLFKRRREIPDINSRNFNVRGLRSGRLSTSPIQGSAADILKIANPPLDQAPERGVYKTKMLLQVHDEIVLQVPAMNCSDYELVRETMESAIEPVQYHWKPMKTKRKTWYEAK